MKRRLLVILLAVGIIRVYYFWIPKGIEFIDSFLEDGYLESSLQSGFTVAFAISFVMILISLILFLVCRPVIKKGGAFASHIACAMTEHGKNGIPRNLLAVTKEEHRMFIGFSDEGRMVICGVDEESDRAIIPHLWRYSAGISEVREFYKGKDKALNPLMVSFHEGNLLKDAGFVEWEYSEQPTYKEIEEQKGEAQEGTNHEKE